MCARAHYSACSLKTEDRDGTEKTAFRRQNPVSYTHLLVLIGNLIPFCFHQDYVKHCVPLEYYHSDCKIYDTHMTDCTKQ